MKHQILVINIITIIGMTAALTSCGSTAVSASGNIEILPENCHLNVGQQTPLTLNGQINPNASINWGVSDGSIISSPPNISAMFTAPTNPATVKVTVVIISTPGVEVPITRECNVMPTDTPPALPLDATATLILPSSIPMVAITEVMSNVCGGDDYKKYNEYVELYNYGDAPIDVRGWWLYDPGPIGTPDSLITWSERMPNAVPDTDVITNTTIIPSHGFAVILSPLYVNGIAPHSRPYDFPANTIILSIKESERLGDDTYGIVGTGLEPDFLVLYTGGSNSIEQVISTYGNPKRADHLQDFVDPPGDGMPLEDLPECWSAEKIDPSRLDEYQNWYRLRNGSPGQASYR